MKIAFIGTYPPRECGIGTFTQNLFSAMTNRGKDNRKQHEGIVVAMHDQDQPLDYPREVQLKIRQEQQGDYIEAARFINLSGADTCILEHEYGIFGGQNGVYILPLLHRLEIPLIVTLHTVLKTPSYNEKAILLEVCKMAARIIVMTHKAVEFLTEIYNVEPSKIELIEHGVPDFEFDHDLAKKEFKLESKNVLLTFGFISRNKGIETVIKALPAVVAKYPDTIYIVAGKTHPAVIRHSGEEYRIFLLRLAKKLQLDKHVLFLNEFIDQEELFQYLHASDIYITPYLNEAQITSGTLSYAVGAGTAVISTPYWHATELLADGRGMLFDFNDSDGLATILTDLLDHPAKLKTLRQKAHTYGLEITWPKAGAKYIAVAKAVMQEGSGQPPKKETILDPLLLPPFLLDHIKRMTDDTGIIQHAKFGIPNLKEGYCLDDNARALLMVLMAHKQMKLPIALDLLPVYLSYIHYMQNEDGSFRNFLSFRRDFLDEQGSEDSFGRTIWALGYLLGNAPNDAYFQSGQQIFFEAVPNFEKLGSIRSIANTMIGTAYYLQKNPNDENIRSVLRVMAYKLVDRYNENKTEDWRWFEGMLAYDNAILPLALLHAAGILNDEQIRNTALESMQFLSDITLKDGSLSLVGNENWYMKDGESSRYAQQPLDALAMVLMFHQAFHLTKDKTYLNKLYASFMWFLGENDMRMCLYDFETKGCCDGLESYGVNRNQGAESTLAYLISHLTVLQAFDDFYKADQ
ncbi:MAG: glycosyltransferase [Chitinophagaceae bacterium]|nr:MAG: glycosyltransferase [Chitinophagaceae bacterium]